MFTDDIIAQFLLRLPLHSVFRFKCVSKAWNSLISEPYFKRNYKLRSQGVGVNACSFFYYDYSNYDPPIGPARFFNIFDHGDQLISHSFDFIDTLGQVVASCKGLLLLRSHHKVCVCPRFYVCDPVTGKHVALPPLEEEEEYWFFAHGLLCEEGGHYTVVVLVGTGRVLFKHVVKIETYSSKTGQWVKSVITISSVFLLVPHRVAQVVGEVLYWWESCFMRLLAYDPNHLKQHGQIIEVPLCGYDEVYTDERLTYHARGISETKDGYLQYYRQEYCIEIFVLNEPTTSLYNTEEVIGYQRWNLIHKIDIFNHMSVGPSDNVWVFKFNPLDPQRLFLWLRTGTDKLMVSYDYRNGKIDQICSFDARVYKNIVLYQHPLWPLLC